jgi:hypothetical protein
MELEERNEHSMLILARTAIPCNTFKVLSLVALEHWGLIVRIFGTDMPWCCLQKLITHAQG